VGSTFEIVVPLRLSDVAAQRQQVAA